ncbi:MAG: hypothetical protein EOO62_37695 [Hymenobacter sp.]|nr:MAG: hypothetical protein EOO62_37695 [Hymenobacter sp.]
MNMPSLALALEDFYQISQRHPEQVLGSFEKRAQPRLLPQLPSVRLSPELGYLYSHYHCDALFGHPSIAFTSFEELERRQEGFATYSTDGGRTLHPNPDWNPAWTVFADVNDDPIVADTGTAGTPVYAAIEAVDYELIAPSLAIFFTMLTQMMAVTASLKAQQPTSDDTEERITFKEEVEIPAVLKQMATVADSQYVRALGYFLYS